MRSARTQELELTKLCSGLQDRSRRKKIIIKYEYDTYIVESV